MALLFRLTPDQTLRSVDDLPGVVGAGVLAETGPTFTVDPSYEPSELVKEQVAKQQTGIVMETRWEDGDREPASPVDIEDAIAACEGPGELFTLLQFAGCLVVGAANRYVPEWSFEEVAKGAEWASCVRDAIAERLAS